MQAGQTYLVPGVSTGAPTPMMTAGGYAAPGVYGGPPVPMVAGAGGGGGVVMVGGAGGGGAAIRAKGQDDCANSCGMGGDACGVGGGAGAEANVLHEVGHGRGDWVAETTYRTVQPGMGTFKAAAVPVRIDFWCLWWLVPLLLLLLTYWVVFYWGCHEWRNGWWIPFKDGVEKCHAKAGAQKCFFWGDPHYWTFDNAAHSITYPEDAYPNGDFWIIKSDKVWVQGRYRPTNWLMKNHNNDRACARAIGFSGPFIGGNKFIIEALQKSTKSTTDDGQITYNGSPILTSLGSTFNSGGISATYSSQGVPLDVRMHMPLKMVTVNFPENIQVTVNRWHEHIDGQITMQPQPGMVGHCGNFNGNPSDDFSAVRDPLTDAHKPLEDIKIPVSDPQLIFEPTTFIEQKNFPPEVSDQDTFNARLGALRDR